MTWRQLGTRARTWRIVHAVWSVVQLLALASVWAAAIRLWRSPRLWAAVALLVGEGVGLVLGRGDCPMGEIQERWGDPVPFFDLLLPHRAAKAAVPILAVISLAGLVALVVRRPGITWRT
jgi:hypothetical protein